MVRRAIHAWPQPADRGRFVFNGGNLAQIPGQNDTFVLAFLLPDIIAFAEWLMMFDHGFIIPPVVRQR
jgi:hypothetical protein